MTEFLWKVTSSGAALLEAIFADWSACSYSSGVISESSTTSLEGSMPFSL